VNYGDPVLSEEKRRTIEILRTTKPVLVTDSEFNHAGKRVFTTFCAGCHGFDGLAVYPGAPSFSMGERIQRNDKDLKSSVVNGKNMMPGWGSMLSSLQIDQALHYLRAMALLSRFSPVVDFMVPDHPYFIFYDPNLL